MANTVIIDRFDGGITNDPNDPRANVARVVSNFDIITDPNRMTPYQSSEDGDSSSSTNKLQQFTIGEKESADGTYVLYGLGVQSGAADAKIFYKDVTEADLQDATWAATTSGEQATGNTAFDLFLYYKKTGKIYGIRTGGQHVWSYDTSADTFAESEQDLGATSTFQTQGIVHSKDDIMYFAADNVIWKNDTDTFTSAVTLPTHMRPRCLTEYGNFLAIAAEPTSAATPGFGGSVVYLWDRDSTLTTFTETVYWGEERLLVLGEINGTLIGVSVAAGDTWFDRRIVFRYLAGNKAVKFAELTTSSDVSLLACGHKHKNRLNFTMGITLNGTFRAGTWSVGGEPGNFTVVQERTLNNDTTFTLDTLNLRPFHYIGDYLFQAYDISGTYSMAKTTDGSTYTAKSLYESTINPGMPLEDRGKKKQLVSVQLTYESLPTAGQVILKYSVDGAADQTVFTETTDGALKTEAVADASGDKFDIGSEIEFTIESTGGAVITEIKYKYEILETLI